MEADIMAVDVSGT